MQDIYIKGALRYLVNNFQNSIQKQNDNIATQRVAIFISFNVILFFAYFILWIPLLIQVQKDVSKFFFIYKNNILNKYRFGEQIPCL